MLDLQAGIDLQKVERLTFGIVDEFDGARTAVVDRLAQLHRRGVQGAPHGIRQVGSRALLKDFLMAPLGGAVLLAKGNHLPLTIAEQLHFQMASTGDVGFEKDAAIAEVALAQTFHRIKSAGQLCPGVAYLHADAATASGGLEHYRVADTLGVSLGVFQRGQQR